MTDTNVNMPDPAVSVDDSVPTAIIYSIQDLSHFTVAIHHQGKAEFIQKSGSPEVFLSVAQAKQAALANKAEKGYMALSVACQETGDLRKGRLYEYMPTDLTSHS